MKHTFRGVEIELESTARDYVARATVPSKYGPVIVQVAAPKVTARELAGLFPQLVSAGEHIESGFLADLAKGLNQTLKNKTFQQVAKVVSQVADNPVLQGAAAAMGGPMASAALASVGGAAKMAANFGAKVRRGDPKARQDMRGLRERAKTDPKARRAFAMIKAAIEEQIAQGQGAQPTPTQPAPGFPMGVPVAMAAYEQFMEAWDRAAEPTTWVQLADGSVAPDVASGCIGAPRWERLADGRMAQARRAVPGGVQVEPGLYTQGPGVLQYVMPVYQNSHVVPPVAFG